MLRKRCLCVLAGLGLWLVMTGVRDVWSADMFQETFDARQDGVTIDGIDSWQVAVGSPSNAIAKSNVTFSGEGKSLKIVNAAVPVKVNRSASYGGLTPTWIEMVVRPGLGNQASAPPTGGVGAVCFDTSGNILAADGTAWIQTGKTFDPGTWYRVLLRVDFTGHVYGIYISPASTPKIPFVPDKDNLRFIDPSVNSINKLGFDGVYAVSQTGDTYVDEITVHFVQRLAFITAAQNLVKNVASNSITLQIQNADAEPQTAWENLSVDLRSSSEGGQFSLDKNDWNPVTQVIIPKDAQQAIFYYKDSGEGKPVITAQETPDRGWDDASQQLNVAGEGQFFEISAISPQVAGVPFSVQIIAKDAEGNPDRFYGGAVNLSVKYTEPAAGSRQISPTHAAGFAEGILDLPVSYSDCGSIQIMAEDQSDSTKKGISGQIEFVPAQFSVEPQALQQVVSRPFSVLFAALDAGGNVTPNYKGPATLQRIAVSPANTSGALVPAQLEAAAFEGGQASVDVSYDRWGSIRMEVQDASKPTQKGESGDISFGPSALSVKVIAPPSGRDFYYTGESIEAVISVNDANKQPIRNFQGAVELISTPALDIPSAYSFAEPDAGQKSILFSAQSAGNYVLKTSSAAYSLAAESEPFPVKQATIEVISGAAPIGTTEVQIQLVDEKGKRIISENSLIIQIFFEESDPNNSVFLSSPGKPILFRNGLARLVIGDTEAETVTIAPSAGAGFKIKAGTVTFGRVGKSGIGALMLLESKDDLEPPSEKREHGKK
ncbi:MAG: hypothetical protein A3C47_03325 [Omnitrophica bacterium RIFCSPHIGHO2_02_FULL_51_18]|nr:MAG: hypothetical protein A3C47_03325 [Omnitrophica bacterium RIFCSPHIGHO2_02_FULL_51_18]